MSRLSDALIAVDIEGNVTAWSHGARILYGQVAEHVLGRPLSAAVGAPVDLAAIVASGAGSGETHFSADGAPLPVRISAMRIDGGYAVVSVADGTDEQAQQRFRALLNSLEVGIIVVGADDGIEFSNRAAGQIMGISPAQLIDIRRGEHAIDLPLYDKNDNVIGHGAHPLTQIRNSGKDFGGDVVGFDTVGEKRVWVRGYSHLLNPDNPRHSAVLFSFVDVTDYFDAERRLQREAIYDSLTGLHNRGYALRRAAESLTESSQPDLAAVLFIDLDNLKLINDSYGHLIGDEALQTLARRLQDAARPTDVVARVGGDEFLALLLAPINSEWIDVLANRFHTALEQPVDIGAATIKFSASIGITTREPDDPRTLPELLRDADAAMYRAKASGPGNTVYHR
ncbi:diguanylate cyclase domain-containing protein [Mycobacterium parmense]|nr:diguanylate cyclase [Mycobacterium parmense]MCV7349608.1 diguanylate cyclase [Mycobacterium parmense]ORW58894.1 hypothetical protein AWC20_11220 [Mycobacterium parmense]